MKKLIFYLGMLCVLAFSHQYAYANSVFYIDTSANPSFWTDPHIAVYYVDNHTNNDDFSTFQGSRVTGNIWKFDINYDNVNSLFFYNGTNKDKVNGSYFTKDNNVKYGACYVLNAGFYNEANNMSSKIIQNYTVPTETYYICGEFTQDNNSKWIFLDKWKFTHINGTEYTLTVPDNSWKSEAEFKVAVNNWGTAWGNQTDINVNSEAVKLTTNTEGNTNATMVASVPAGATVSFNSQTGAFKVEYPVVKPTLKVTQKEITGKTGDEAKQNGLTFDLIVKGSAPEEFSALLKQNITGYNLTVTGRFIEDKNGKEGSRMRYGSTVSDAPSSGKIVLNNIPADANFNMPDVTLTNAIPGEKYTFTLDMIFTNADMPEATAACTVNAPAAVLAVNAPHFENTANVTMADLNKEGATAQELADAVAKARAAVNYVATDGQITLSGLSSTVAWTPTFKVSYDAAADKKTVSEASPAKNVYITNLPYSGAGAEQTYSFSVSTVYTYNNDETLTFATDFKKTDYDMSVTPAIPAPRTGSEEVTIKLYENYSERFYGLHSYWQDAFVTVPLANSPIPEYGATDQLCGSLKQETVNGITGVAPIEAGGNYAFGKLSNEAITALWYQPMPEGVSGHEHYKGHLNSAPFFAGTDAEGHDPRNQWFCTVNHFTDDASKGFGTITDWERGNFFDADISGDINAEATWYKDKRIYRKVHHVNHEARYFGNGTSLEDHIDWKIPFSDYQPMQARISYQYNMLTSDKYVSLTFAEPAKARPLQSSPRKITPAEGEYAPVYAGLSDAGQQLSFDNVTDNDYFMPGTTTGIGSVDYDGDNAPVEYYNLQGVKVDNPVPGSIYIFRQGSRSGKVLIK